MTQSGWIGVREAARILGVTEYTVRKYARDGKIKARKVGGRWLVVASDVLPPPKD